MSITRFPPERIADQIYARAGGQNSIACSLGDSSALDQLDEWCNLLAEATTRVDRVTPTELRWQLRDNPRQVEAVVRLAQRE